MKTKVSKWYSLLAPRPTVLISTIGKNGISNAAPFSFVMPVSMDPPIIAFASAEKRHTLKNIRETGDFAVNIPSARLLKQVWTCSQAFPQEVSEIEKAGLSEVKSKKIRSPKIKECFARFECTLLSEHQAGDHIIVIGELLDIEVEDSVFEEDKFNLKKANPLMHVGSVDFATVGDMLKCQG